MNALVAAQNRKAHRHLLHMSRPLKGNLYPLLKQAAIAEMPTRRRGSLVMVLARAIVGQQVAAKVAATFWKRLEDKALAAEISLVDFLVPKNQQAIRQCGMSNNKVRFLVGLGEAHRQGAVSARRVNAMTHDRRIEYLSQLDGIGVWSCDMVGIFYCHDSDIWPQGDLAVRRTFGRLVGIDEKKIEEKTVAFSPFRTYLALHMWREKNNPLIRD